MAATVLHRFWQACELRLFHALQLPVCGRDAAPERVSAVPALCARPCGGHAATRYEAVLRKARRAHSAKLSARRAFRLAAHCAAAGRVPKRATDVDGSRGASDVHLHLFALYVYRDPAGRRAVDGRYRGAALLGVSAAGAKQTPLRNGARHGAVRLAVPAYRVLPRARYLHVDQPVPRLFGRVCLRHAGRAGLLSLASVAQESLAAAKACRLGGGGRRVCGKLRGRCGVPAGAVRREHAGARGASAGTAVAQASAGADAACVHAVRNASAARAAMAAEQPAHALPVGNLVQPLPVPPAACRANAAGVVQHRRAACGLPAEMRLYAAVL